MKRSNAGFTLIELLAALAVFALVAVMAAQALNGALRHRDGLAARDDAAAALGRSLALMRRDLESALPLAFHPATGNTPSPALEEITGAGGGFALSIGSHPRLPGEGGEGLARVLWRVDSARGVLTRQHWPGLSPAATTDAGPLRDMLAGVRSLSIEPLGDWPERGDNPASLPPGFQVVLETHQQGRLRLVVAR